ncbi:MAG: efflux RND transporter periplasmic adaptor subunit [Phycisphaerales bacterium]
MRPFSSLPRPLLPFLPLALALAGAACDRKPPAPPPPPAAAPSAPAPTNRVDIPAPVRLNLGISFAKVELRRVAQTIRLPGRFELLANARREYGLPLAGRVELLALPLQRVEAGAPLFSVSSPAWRDLHEQIEAVTAKVESMVPLREAHRLHERRLAEKVTLWEGRIKELDQLRAAGGGSAAAMIDARATLNQAQAELADVMERDAELEAENRQAESEQRALRARRELLARARNCSPGAAEPSASEPFIICALAPGVVESVAITPGALAPENATIMTLVQPEVLRFVARGLQSDLGRLQDGMPVRIAPPQGSTIDLQDTLTGTLRIGLAADPDERTVDLTTTPKGSRPWARAGVSAFMEVTTAGGAEALAIPLSAVVRDGAVPVIFRRDPANPDKVIRLEADIGLSDGRWIVIASGVKEGDEIVLGGNYQLMLATSGSASKAGHFHSDGTFHDGEH